MFEFLTIYCSIAYKKSCIHNYKHGTLLKRVQNAFCQKKKSRQQHIQMQKDWDQSQWNCKVFLKKGNDRNNNKMYQFF